MGGILILVSSVDGGFLHGNHKTPTMKGSASFRVFLGLLFAILSIASPTSPIEEWQFSRVPGPPLCFSSDTASKALSLKCARQCAADVSCLAYKYDSLNGHCLNFAQEYTNEVLCHEKVYNLNAAESFVCMNGGSIHGRNCACQAAYTGKRCETEIVCHDRDQSIVSADGASRSFQVINLTNYPVALYYVTSKGVEVFDRQLSSYHSWLFGTYEGRVYVGLDAYGQYAAFGDARQCQFTIPLDAGSQSKVYIHPQAPP